MIEEYNKAIEAKRDEFIQLVKVAGFNDIKEFSELKELGLKYSAVIKWGNEITRGGKSKGKLRPVPQWVFSWLNLYIKNKELSQKVNNFKNDGELLRENTILKERMNAVYKIVSVDKD